MISDLLSHWPIYLALGLPLLGAVLVFGLRLARPKFQGLWFVALLSALLTLAAVILARPEEVHFVPLLSWQPAEILPFSPALLIDSVSWPFSVSLAVLLLAILLTAVVRLNPGSWRAWSGSLGLTGLGLVAVWAGNPLTFLLAWSALDLLELLVQLFQVRQSEVREGGVLAFTARVAGTAMFILAIVVSRTLGVELGFGSVPVQVAPLLILAAGLRLGVLPLQAPLLEEIPMRRGVGTALRLAPAAASLVLLVRIASIPLTPLVSAIFLVFASLAAFYSGFAWLTARTELSGRPFWLLGLASLAVAAAVRGDVPSAMAWGLALLFSGGLLFLYSARHPYLNILVLVGMLAASGMPFSPTWGGAALFLRPESGPILGWWIIPNVLLFVALVSLLLGYLRHTFSAAESMHGREAWAWLIYSLGLAILPLTHFGLGWLYRPALDSSVSLSNWFFGVAVLGITSALWWFNERDPIRLPGEATFRTTLKWGASFWGQLLSLIWFYRILWSIYHLFSRVFQIINRLLEGEGGLLWAFLLLLLIFTLAANGLAGL